MDRHFPQRYSGSANDSGFQDPPTELPWAQTWEWEYLEASEYTRAAAAHYFCDLRRPHLSKRHAGAADGDECSQMAACAMGGPLDGVEVEEEEERA